MYTVIKVIFSFPHIKAYTLFLIIRPTVTVVYFAEK